jgi:glucuronosyltransferase
VKVVLFSAAHPNTRLFVTHGGLLSMQEAIDRGVPVVGIPVFGDQHLNIIWAVSEGFGVSLDFNNITSESVSKALNEVLNNSRYSIQKFTLLCSVVIS